jgi:hypothetical protein
MTNWLRPRRQSTGMLLTPNLNTAYLCSRHNLCLRLLCSGILAGCEEGGREMPQRAFTDIPLLFATKCRD